MAWRLAADSVLVTHLLFIVFIVVGGFVARRYRWVVGPHLLVVAYSVVIAAVGFTCPLTPLEKHLRASAGSAGYEGGFVEHYIVKMIYPGSINSTVRAVLVSLVVLATVIGYRHAWPWPKARGVKSRVPRPAAVGTGSGQTRS